MDGVWIVYRKCMESVWKVYEKSTPTSPNKKDYGILKIKKQDLYLNIIP